MTDLNREKSLVFHNGEKCGENDVIGAGKLNSLSFPFKNGFSLEFDCDDFLNKFLARKFVDGLLIEEKLVSDRHGLLFFKMLENDNCLKKVRTKEEFDQNRGAFYQQEYHQMQKSFSFQKKQVFGARSCDQKGLVMFLLIKSLGIRERLFHNERIIYLIETLINSANPHLRINKVSVTELVQFLKSRYLVV